MNDKKDFYRNCTPSQLSWFLKKDLEEIDHPSFNDKEFSVMACDDIIAMMEVLKERLQKN